MYNYILSDPVCACPISTHPNLSLIFSNRFKLLFLSLTGWVRGYTNTDVLETDRYKTMLSSGRRTNSISSYVKPAGNSVGTVAWRSSIMLKVEHYMLEKVYNDALHHIAIEMLLTFIGQFDNFHTTIHRWNCLYQTIPCNLTITSFRQVRPRWAKPRRVPHSTCTYTIGCGWDRW